jgi:hypothetical protein
MRASILPVLHTVLLSVALAPLDGEAQTIPSPYRFVERKQESGLFAGLMSADRGRFGYGPGGGPIVGGRWGIELSGPLSLEGVATLLSGRRDVIHPGRVEGERKIGEAEQLLTMLEARLKFSLVGARAWHGLSPFIVAGGGIAFDLAGSAPDDGTLEPADVFEFGSSFIGTLGAGTRWFATDRVALRTDALFSLWEIPTPLGYADPARAFEAVAEKEWLRGLQVSVSAVVRW